MSILPGPVNALFGETVAGAAVVRAFGMQSVFVQSKFFVHLLLLFLINPDLVTTTNMYQSTYVVSLSIGRWLIRTLLSQERRLQGSSRQLA
jgi:hypothetical protein